jgi:hypothetical protein
VPARVERFPLQHGTSASVLKPLLGWAALAAILALIRRVTREPSLPRMSEQWLLGHQHQFNRDQYDR